MSLPFDPNVADAMSDMEQDLLYLLTREVNSFGRWDVLRFFLESDNQPATLDEIALATGRDAGALLDVTGALVSVGWLARRTEPGEPTTYRLTQARDRRLILDRLQASMYDRDFRLKAIYHWSHEPDAERWMGGR